MNYYIFTKCQLFDAIANWKNEPFTLKEINFLLKEISKIHFLKYGLNDIDSLILELLDNI